jgi:hypothetical protein
VKLKRTLVLLALVWSAAICNAAETIWPAAKAATWYQDQGWLVGANFLPSTAINQLEMWQADTFDPLTIDRELGWAEGIGMNVMRVYLHDLAWRADPAGFKRRMSEFLAIASRHRIRILFTLLDDCWNPDANVGRQPEPKPGVHNSGWVRSPSKAVHDDPSQWGYLEEYVKDVLRSFRDDRRILMWDLYNEPGNSGYDERSLPLLKRVFDWAWSVRPSQPLTSGTWYDNKTLTAFQLASSDVITFHNYNDAASLERELAEKTRLGRPVICTEYMARSNNSRFATHLPIFKRYGVGAINWGLVSGRSNTIFPWGSKQGSPEPSPWFHDVFRRDGTPYDPAETSLIKELTARR